MLRETAHTLIADDGGTLLCILNPERPFRTEIADMVITGKEEYEAALFFEDRVIQLRIGGEYTWTDYADSSVEVLLADWAKTGAYYG